MRQRQRADAAVTRRICVEDGEVVRAPHRRRAVVTARHQVLPVATHRQALQAVNTRQSAAQLDVIFTAHMQVTL